SLRIWSTPVAFASPCSKAARQCLTLPSAASSLKCERVTSSRTFASEAMSFVTTGPGFSTRYIWMSPRPRSSSPTTSLNPASAGTSARKFRAPCSISALVSDGELRAPTLDLVALEQLLADHHALDLGRALADQQQRRVAVEALD